MNTQKKFRKNFWCFSCYRRTSKGFSNVLSYLPSSLWLWLSYNERRCPTYGRTTLCLCPMSHRSLVSINFCSFWEKGFHFFLYYRVLCQIVMAILVFWLTTNSINLLQELQMTNHVQFGFHNLEFLQKRHFSSKES